MGRRIKTIIFTCLLLFAMCPVWANDSLVADLMRLDTASKVQSRVLLLDRLADGFYETSPKKADSLARAGLSLALRQTYPAGIARMHYRLGRILRLQGQYEKAELHLILAAEFYTLSPNRKKLVLEAACVDQELGNIKYHRGEYPEALSMLLKGKKTFEAYQAEHKIFPDPRFTRLQADLDQVYETLIVFGESEIAFRHVNQRPLFYLTGSQKEPFPMAQTYLILGEVMFVQQRYAESQAAFYDCIAIAQKIGARHLEAIAYRNLSELHESQKDWEASIEAYQSFMHLNDSVFSKENIIDLEKTFDITLSESWKTPKVQYLELKNHVQFLQLQKTRLLNRLLGGAFVAIAFGLVFISMDRRKKKQVNRRLEYQNQEQKAEAILHEQRLSTLSKSEAFLRKSDNSKAKLLSILAHDLRGKLGGITAFTKILKEEVGSFSADQIRDFAGKLHQSSSSLFELLENILQWSTAQSQQVCCNPESFSLKALFTQNLLLHEVQAVEKGIRLSVYADKSLLLYTDKNMVDFVIRNLIANAIKFTHPGGRINLEAISEGQDATLIRISDTGVGISEAVKATLLNMDRHPTTQGTANEKGSGLGLLLCNEFLQKMGTQLQYTSTQGQGTTFYFSIPRYVPVT